MQLDWATIQGILTLLIAGAAFYFARKKDTYDAGAQVTTVIVELQTVRRDISEMKTDVAAMRQEWRDDHDKLVGMERDIKAMWKHIDKFNGKAPDKEAK